MNETAEPPNPAWSHDGETARKLAKVEAQARRGWEAVAILYDSPFLDGLARTLAREYPDLGDADVDVAVAKATDLVVEKINEGRVNDPVLWALKLGRDRALDVLRSERATPTDELEEEPAPALPGSDGVSREVLRREAVRVVRSVIEEVKRPRQQQVLRLIVDAVADGGMGARRSSLAHGQAVCLGMKSPERSPECPRSADRRSPFQNRMENPIHYVTLDLCDIFAVKP